MTKEFEAIIIKNNFKKGLYGVIKDSGGFKELFITRYNLLSIIVSFFLLIIYLLQVKNASHAVKFLEILNDKALPLLGGIVGLSLAGLTLIITFSNREIIDRCSSAQYSDFKKNGMFNASYFQKVVAKFAFIVLIQVLTLLLFFFTSLLLNFKININECCAFCINTIIFLLESYLIIYSFLLVIALILNLFTFSQTSNFIMFMKYYKPEVEKND
jgi:hypothetical protein